MIAFTLLLAFAPADDLAQGVALFEQQALEESQVALERALTGERYSREQVVLLLHHLGVVRSYLDDEVGARDTFTRLLSISPAHFLPYTISPRTTHLFSEVRNAAPAPIAMSLYTPLRAGWNTPIELRIERGADPSQELTDVEVLVRQQGSANYRVYSVAAPRPGEVTTLRLEGVPRPELDGDVNLEIALVARNTQGWELFRGPDPANPRSLVVGVVQKPWYADEGTLWVLGGTAAAAVIGTAILAAMFYPPPERVPLSLEVR